MAYSNKKMYASGLVVAGAFFLAEHIYNFGFEYNDFIGHDYLGAGLIIGGIVLGAIAYRQENKK